MNSEEWKGYTLEEKLYVICKKMHVLKFAQFVNRKMLGRGVKTDSAAETHVMPDAEQTVIQKEKNAAKDNWIRMEGEFNEVIRAFRAVIPSEKKKVIFSGHVLEFDKGTCKYLNYISENLDNAELILLSHATKINNAKANKLINFNYFKLPVTASLNRYEANVDAEVPEKILQFLEQKEYLKIAVERLEKRHKDMGKGYAKALTYNLYRYFEAFLDHFRPAAVILWCEFFCGHVILKDICEEKGIDVLYMEFGALPGTFAIEKNGQMGESDVSVKYKDFLKLPVTEEELENADEILGFLKESGLNRRPQLKTDAIKKIQEKYNPDYPTVVFFGQNDFEAGIMPYTARSRQYHSPTFTSSDDAAMYLYSLAKANHWNFIYKPHQVIVRVGECLEEKFPSSMIWVGDTDINEIIDLADVCVTIVSQCGYVSLIRQKPTVMLGYTQLRGKDCSYEAFEKEQVEGIIKKAISEGYTQKQRNAFRKHVAQLLKYYLFDDQLEKPFKIGRGINEAVDFCNEQIRDRNVPDYVEERKILFLCKNIKEYESACIVKKHMNVQAIADVILEKNISLELLDEIKEKGRFRKVIAIKEEMEVEEADFYVYEMGLIEEGYTDLFASLYDGVVLRIYDLLKGEKNLNVHLYDSGNLELYLKDIAADRDRRKGSNRLSHFFADLSEIILFDRRLLVWGGKVSMPVTIMHDEKVASADCDNRKLRFCVSENWLFSRGYTSNETELVEEISTIVGDREILVEVPDSESDLRYLLRGYEQCQSLDCELIKEDENEDVIVFTMFIDEYYHMLDLNDHLYVIDLSKMLITNCNILNSNSFKLLYSLVDEEKKERYYRPSSMEELSEILLYVECGKK